MYFDAACPSHDVFDHVGTFSWPLLKDIDRATVVFRPCHWRPLTFGDKLCKRRSRSSTLNISEIFVFRKSQETRTKASEYTKHSKS